MVDVKELIAGLEGQLRQDFIKRMTKTMKRKPTNAEVEEKISEMPEGALLPVEVSFNFNRCCRRRPAGHRPTEVLYDRNARRNTVTLPYKQCSTAAWNHSSTRRQTRHDIYLDCRAHRSLYLGYDMIVHGGDTYMAMVGCPVPAAASTTPYSTNMFCLRVSYRPFPLSQFPHPPHPPSMRKPPSTDCDRTFCPAFGMRHVGSWGENLSRSMIPTGTGSFSRASSRPRPISGSGWRVYSRTGLR